MHRASTAPSSKRPPRPLRMLIGILATVAAVCCVPAVAVAEGETGYVTFPGTPMKVSIGALGQCESSYPLSGGNYFPGAGTLGDCGFFLAFPKTGAGQPKALQAQTFGFAGFAGPHLPNEYVPVSQSPVSGSGTEAAPYTQTTVFKVVDSEEHEDALITETTTYVNGQPEFTSSFDVKNVTNPATKIYFRAMYAGDLYVNGNDYGTGVFLGGPPRFVGGQNTASGVLGGFQEAPAPALPWSSFQEGCWNETAFENEGGVGRCEAASPTDQGIWNDVRTPSKNRTPSTKRSIQPRSTTQQASSGTNCAKPVWKQARNRPSRSSTGPKCRTPCR